MYLFHMGPCLGLTKIRRRVPPALLPLNILYTTVRNSPCMELVQIKVRVLVTLCSAHDDTLWPPGAWYNYSSGLRVCFDYASLGVYNCSEGKRVLDHTDTKGKGLLRFVGAFGTSKK